jgi:hypothetical protein
MFYVIYTTNLKITGVCHVEFSWYFSIRHVNYVDAIDTHMYPWKNFCLGRNSIDLCILNFRRWFIGAKQQLSPPIYPTRSGGCENEVIADGDDMYIKLILYVARKECPLSRFSSQFIQI